MRDIKFRAWSKEDNKMRYHAEQAANGHNQMNDIYYFYQLLDNPKYELMQYTGLRDVNSEDIYEGDIVEVDYPNYTQRFVVIFDAGMFKVKKIDDDIEGNGFSLCTITGERKCKIVGNIYENPGLLKKI